MAPNWSLIRTEASWAMGKIHKYTGTELPRWWQWRAEEVEALSWTASPWPQEDTHSKLRGSDLQPCICSLHLQAFSNCRPLTFSEWGLSTPFLPLTEHYLQGWVPEKSSCWFWCTLITRHQQHLQSTPWPSGFPHHFHHVKGLWL